MNITTSEASNSQQPSGGGRRLAMVVGVNQSAELMSLAPATFAESSAQAIATVLQNECQFALIASPLLAEGATTDNVKRTIRSLVHQGTDHDFLLFYFVGHGYPLFDHTEQKQVYLVTHDFNLEELRVDDTAMLSLAWLKSILYERTNAGQVLIVLDCCYAGNIGQLEHDQPLEHLFKAITAYLQPSEQNMGRAKKTRVTLAATIADAVAYEHDGSTALTGWLLKALQGEIQDIFNDAGEITLGRLHDTLQECMPEQPISLLATTAGQRMILASRREWSRQERDRQKVAQQATERHEYLRSLFTNDEAFMRDRLKRFVGRECELVEVHQRIEALKLTGGYLTIMAGAGEGKSSLIARLIKDYSEQRGGTDQVAFHFIPLAPTANYQVPLLKSLMARLIIIHQQSDLYVQTDERASLTAYFARLLREIARQGRSEVIFIDGLDQLPTDFNGTRDLSFLPSEPENPPVGIVFVLGTRPNETLRPLQILKPLESYLLPHLERDDFTLLLQRCKVSSLETRQADQLYRHLDENALFLDLAAQELQRRPEITRDEVEAIIQLISANPENLFALALERMGRYDTHNLQWERIIKPLLGLLLVTHEALAPNHLKQLINLEMGDEKVDGDQLRAGLERLGGLLRVDEQQLYTLSHLKFRDFLRGPSSQQVFDEEDERGWQRCFVRWCQQGDLQEIWKEIPHDRIERIKQVERIRRRYACQYYINHLYDAYEWERLFVVLDEGLYGQAKVQDDPSMHAYALDLDLGRQAAASSLWGMEEGVNHLAFVYRYTLLRCSLASRADRYPQEAFILMLMLGQETKALRLAELLTKPDEKVMILLLMADYLRGQLGREQDAERLVFRAEEVVERIPSRGMGGNVLTKLGETLLGAQRWQDAEQVISSIEDEGTRAEALAALGSAYIKVDQWQDAEKVISSIRKKDDIRGGALAKLGLAYAGANQWQDAKRVWQVAEQVISSIKYISIRAEALAKLGLAYAEANRWQDAEQVILSIEYASIRAEALAKLGQAYAEANRWQDAERIISSILGKDTRGRALVKLGQVYAGASRWQDATRIWQDAEQVISSIRGKDTRGRALAKLGQIYAEASRWQDATRIWQDAEQVVLSVRDKDTRERALAALGQVYAKADRWRDAERIISSVRDDGRRERSFVELSLAYANANRRQDATRVWQDAERIVTSLVYEEERGNALMKLGLAYAKDDRWQDAERVIFSIRDKDTMRRARVELWRAYAKVNRWQDAERIITSLVDKWERRHARAELGLAYAKDDRWQDAERVIFSIRDKDTMRRARVELWRAYAKANRWQDAERIVTSLVDEWERIELGLAYANANRWQDATRVCQDVERVLDRNDEWGWDRALMKLGQAYAKINRWQDAERVISSIQIEWRREIAIVELWQAYAKVNRWQDTERVISSIGSLYTRERELVKLGLTNQWQNVEQMISSIEVESVKGEAYQEIDRWWDAVHVIFSVQDEMERERAITGLWQACAKVNRWQDVERIISSFKDKKERGLALAELGQAYAKANQWRKAKRVWRDAELIISIIVDERARGRGRTKLGQLYAKAGQWGDAERIISSIKDKRELGRGQVELGKIYAEANRWEDAARVWKDAEIVIFSFLDDWQRKEVQVELWQVYMTFEQWESAGRVILSIQDEREWERALAELKQAYAKANQRLDVERIISFIKGEKIRGRALAELGNVLATHLQTAELLHLIQYLWLQAHTRQEAIDLLPLAFGFLPSYPNLGLSFFEAFSWVDNFLQGKQMA